MTNPAHKRFASLNWSNILELGSWHRYKKHCSFHVIPNILHTNAKYPGTFSFMVLWHLSHLIFHHKEPPFLFKIFLLNVIFLFELVFSRTTFLFWRLKGKKCFYKNEKKTNKKRKEQLKIPVNHWWEYVSRSQVLDEEKSGIGNSPITFTTFTNHWWEYIFMKDHPEIALG